MATDSQTERAVRKTMNAALSAILEQGEPAVIVNSPPGAGKTWFCEKLSVLAVESARMRACYVTPKVSQGEDVARRLLASGVRFPIDILVGSTRTPPTDLVGKVNWSSNAKGLGGLRRLMISNPPKLELSRDNLPARPFDLMIMDEAYQIAAKDMALIASLTAAVVMVGDPGQLRPTIAIDTNEFETEGSRVHWPAPLEVLRLHPATPVFDIPASRRLVQDTVTFVQPSFYPDLPFVSAALAEHRRIAFDARGIGSPIDKALELLEQGASIVGITLPGEPSPADERDPEVERMIVDVVQRMIGRGISWPGQRQLVPADIGVVDTHVLSGNATRAGLQERGLNGIRVATPELWQGQQAPVIVAKHPLNVGSAAPGAFHLDPGRYCVMLSRHLLGCIVVGRESIQGRLQDYMHDSRPTPVGSSDRAWDGYRAHMQVWGSLHEQGRIIPTEGWA